MDVVGGKSPYNALPPNLLKREFRRLTNTRFWLTDAELPPELPQLPGVRLTRRVGPVRNAAGNEVWLFEFDEPNPAAWLVPLLIEAAPGDILATVMNSSFDLRRAGLFDSSAVVQGKQISALPEPLSTRARVRYSSGREISIELDAPAPEGAALVVSENWYRGWKALVDGRPANVARADYALMGVPLPAGARRIELLFADPVYARGKIITIVALVLTVILIGGGVAVERRRRA